MSNIKGYKVFNPDWTCRGFQYEVGKTYEHYGNIELCGSGFHFCKKASDCFEYYDFDSRNKVAEVESIGLTEGDETKLVTNKISIIREIEWAELLNIVNEGKDCTGLCNTGNRNTGDCNTGNRNTGNKNTGNKNTGNRNTGNFNTGDKNTGNSNTGNRNTGNSNTGNRNTGNSNTGKWNTGDWNKTNYSTGLFNTKEQKIYIFNKPSNWTLKDWFESSVRSILNWNFELTVWIYEENMTDKEKIENPSYKTTGGYLKKFTFEEACKNMWDCLTEEEKNIVINTLPNFDKNIFKEITGIDIDI